MNKLLSITKAAAELGVAPSTLRRWSDIGLIPFITLPSGQRRFDVELIKTAWACKSTLVIQEKADSELADLATFLSPWKP